MFQAAQILTFSLAFLKAKTRENEREKKKSSPKLGGRSKKKKKGIKMIGNE